MTTTLTLAQAQALPPGQLRDWAYNALDGTGTREISDNLLPRLRGNQSRIYAFERALQAPAMSMMLRGVNVNLPLRDEMIAKLKRELAADMRVIDKMTAIQSVWDGTELETGWCPGELGKRHKWPRGVPDGPDRRCARCNTSRLKRVAFNANSQDQVQHLMYDLLKLEPMTDKTGKVSVNEDILERLGRKHPEVAPITRAILAVRDKKKQLGSLSARLSPDGRYPSSLNVGAAWTGRSSSSKSPFGLGGNLQNVAPRHRRVLIPDVGMDMGYADYMQGESNAVAHLSGDERYIEAHALGDVHTYVTRLIWPELPWTGDLAKDKKVAKVLPPWDPVEGHDYRFQCKRIVHGCNYLLTPRGIVMLYPDIPYPQARKGYENYMTEFDGIPAWHKWIAKEVSEHRPLINPLGREITMFGRAWDHDTVKKATAFLPQSTIADIINIAMWRVWRELEPLGVQLLANVHDALLHQFPRGELELERRLLQLMSIPVPVTDIRGKTRIMRVGVEAAVGKNWGHKSEDNPHGIDEKPVTEYLNAHPL